MLDLLVGGGALLLIHGLAAAGHGDPALIVLDRGAELPVGSQCCTVACTWFVPMFVPVGGLVLRLALGAIPGAALGLQFGRIACLHVCLALSVTHLTLFQLQCTTVTVFVKGVIRRQQ